jgi:membrane-bound serine protease (ClpP class)
MVSSRSALRGAGSTRGSRRRTIRRAAAAICLQLGILALVAPAAANGDHVARLSVVGVIDQMNAAFVDEGLRYAGDAGAAAAIVEIDSPGGDLSSMDAIIKSILGSPVPVITYVTPAGARAGSAATFITLAGDVAAMTPSTNIGAASVISSTGEDLPTTLEEKVTNDAVARIRDLAERQARNADWAESAVREAASISAAQAVAMEPPVVDLLAPHAQALLEAVDEGERADGHPYTFHGEPLPPLADLPIRDVTMNIGQQFLHALSDPNIAFILFTIGFYGIVAELFHPNFFSGIAGGIAIVLAFIGSSSLPLNLGGLLLLLGGPALKIPVASARSFFGNHSETVLIEAGKFPASPRPRTKRTIINPSTDADKAIVQGANPRAVIKKLTPETMPLIIGVKTGNIASPIINAQACAIAATLQRMIDSEKPFFVPNLSIRLPTKSKPMA